MFLFVSLCYSLVCPWCFSHFRSFLYSFLLLIHMRLFSTSIDICLSNSPLFSSFPHQLNKILEQTYQNDTRVTSKAFVRSEIFCLNHNVPLYLFGGFSFYLIYFILLFYLFIFNQVPLSCSLKLMANKQTYR